MLFSYYRCSVVPKHMVSEQLRAMLEYQVPKHEGSLLFLLLCWTSAVDGLELTIHLASMPVKGFVQSRVAALLQETGLNNREITCAGVSATNRQDNNWWGRCAVSGG